MTERTVRQARLDDHEAVAAFTEGTWADHRFEDYMPDLFPEWVESDGPDQHTAVAAVDGDPIAVAQALVLTDDEGWLQGLRVHPDHRGQGHATALFDALTDWCRQRGATVARNMVFGWNEAGLGQSRAVGMTPVTACRWARPEPAGTSVESALTVTEDGDRAWRYWTHSDARTALSGLALDDERAWALAELTRERLAGLPSDVRPIAVGDEETRGMTVRIGTRDHEAETVVDYAVATWDDATAATALFDAIRVDAATRGGDATRVLIPETPRHVSGAAVARAPLSDEPVYVFARDLTGRDRDGIQAPPD